MDKFICCVPQLTETVRLGIILLPVTAEDTPIVFLVDSGSTHSFINDKFAGLFPATRGIRPMKVTIVEGAGLISNRVIEDCKWECDGHQFTSDFRLLELGNYDGILDLDWLASHSPMQIDWQQKWMAFQHKGSMITLQGVVPDEFALTVLSICLELPTA